MNNFPTVSSSPKYLRPWLVALSAFFVVFIPGFVALEAYSKLEAQHIEEHASQTAGALITKLEGRLKENIAVGWALKAHIELLGELDQAGFSILGKRIVDPKLNIRHIALAPDMVISAIYPLAGNEAAIGLDYRHNVEQQSAAMRAIENNQIVLAGPLTLIQGGGYHLVARYPIFKRDSTPWGIVAVVIRFEGLLIDSGYYEWTEGFQIALRGKDGEGASGDFFWGDEALFSTDASRYLVRVPGGYWQLGIRPASGWEMPSTDYLSYMATLVIICLLFAGISYMIYTKSLDKRRYLIHLESLSSIDSLTSLPSRYQFNKRLDEVILENDRRRNGFAVLFIDLDHFKEINDSLGHSYGDELLMIVAEKLKHSIRSYDLVSRLSGDEFVVVFQDIHTTSEIEQRGEALANKLSEPVLVGGVNVSVTCSLGVAVYPEDGTSVEILLKHADRAMYESKRSGRNSLHFYNADMQKEADRYIEITAAMREALNNGAFEVYYQPIYDVRKRRFSRCEALCRWLDSSGNNYLTPDVFIPVAEQSGMIIDLGNWLTTEVFDCMRVMDSQGISLHFSINRSPQEFNSTQNTQKLIELCDINGIDPGSFTLEITESILMSDNKTKGSNIELLRANGFNFSIDDFGTGYSAINYLRKYPVSTLKIDKSFIAELGQSSQTDALVKVVIQMAKALQIEVIAEGVETQRQFDYLEAQGCHYIQGYLLAKPMPKGDLLDFLKNKAINSIDV